MNDAKKSQDPDRTASQVPVDSTKPASDAEHNRSAALSAGMPVVPGYSLEAKIGEGGMGAVYKAVQVKLNRTVALKMIHGGKTAGTRELLRFIAEAEAVAAIDHSNVVKVYDTGDAAGQLYIAMEYLPGGTLADLLAGRASDGVMTSTSPPSLARPANPRQVAELVIKLANAVQAAHDRQIVHRDLKPSNIMFDGNGEPRITDFGLAKRASGDLTNTNAIMGTPAYMAPEQAKGESKFVGPAADVWALGVILYEALSGKRPFTGSNELEILNRVIDQEPSSIRSLSKEVPRDLELIAKKCLAKDAAERYASAKELFEDLQDWLAGKPVSVKAAGSAQRLIKWTARNKLAAGILAATAAAMLVFAGLSVWALAESRRADSSAKTAVVKTGEAEQNLALAKTEAERAKENAAAAVMERDYSKRLLDVNHHHNASTYFERGAVQYARDLLDGITTPDLRDDFTWNLAHRICEGSDWTIHSTFGIQCIAWSPDGSTIASGEGNRLVVRSPVSGLASMDVQAHQYNVTALAWNPDGKSIVTASNDGKLRLWEVATRLCIAELTGHTKEVTSVAWSPDGSTIASGSKGHDIRFWDGKTGAAGKVLKGHIAEVNCIAWSPDGKTLASGGNESVVWLWDPLTGQTTAQLKTAALTVGAVAWRPDGKILAVTHTYKEIQIWDVISVELVDQWEHVEANHTPGQAIGKIAWSLDGTMLASSGLDGNVRLWNPISGQVINTFYGHSEYICDLAWSRDSRTLVTVGTDFTLRFWNTETAQTPETLEVTQKSIHLFQGPFKLWSPDAKSVAFVSFMDRVILLDQSTQRIRREWQDPAESIVQMQWSPKGQTLATVGSDHQIRLWNPGTGECRKELKGHTSTVHSITWSPDERRVASVSADNTMRIWNADTAECQVVPFDSGLEWSMLAWSPDGRLIAIVGGANSILLWDVIANKEYGNLTGHTALVKTIA